MFNSAMWITPLPPLLNASGKGSHGSVLSENYALNRLSSECKSTAIRHRSLPGHQDHNEKKDYKEVKPQEPNIVSPKLKSKGIAKNEPFKIVLPEVL
jgi:hypothetical protein